MRILDRVYDSTPSSVFVTSEADWPGKLRRQVLSAMSWLSTEVALGFVAYADVMYPSFSDPVERYDEPEPPPKRGGDDRPRREGLWARLSRAWTARVTVRTLERLDDHTLKDIGMHRCQIESEVRHGDRYQW